MSAAGAPAVAELTADRVGAEITAAYQGTSAVHVRATTTEGSTTSKVDVQLNKDSAGGTITQGDATVPVRRVGGVYYVQMTDSVLKMAGLSPTASPGRLMRNKWVSSESKLGAEVTNNTKEALSYEEFISHTAGEITKGTFTAAGKDSVDGVPVLVFKDGDGSTSAVTEASPHYLIRATNGTDTLDFSGWDEPVAVTAPAAADLYSGPGA